MRMTNSFELCKRLLATLMLAGLVTVFMPGCSSTDDPVMDESSGAGRVSAEAIGLEDCSVFTDQVNIGECENSNEIRRDSL
jgi:hypothetical protein